MRELRAQLLSAGCYRHHEAASWAKLGILLAVLGGVIAGTILGPWWVALLLVPMGSVAAAAAAMLGHEGSHRSFSPSPRRNAVLNHIAFPLLGGLGALYWRHKHDNAHHGHPNVHAADPDIELWPMVSSSQAHAKCGPKRRWFQRNLQGYAFWPLTLFLPMMMRIASVRHLLAAKRKDAAWFADATCLAIHYTAWIVVPTFFFGFLATMAFYIALWAGVGILLALVFAPAHMGLPVILDQNNDWLHQLETTRNLKLPRVLRWFFIGLDYQIEHHLFPKIPHQELPRACEVVEAWCAKHGFPHMEIGYGDAVVDVTRFIRDAWKTPAQSGQAVRQAAA
jgi:fatty acid desaturase